MSEQLLRAIIHLLAIVAKEDDVTADERKAIEDFLLENLNQKDSLRFLRLFDEMTTNMANGRNVSFSEEKEISILAKQVNQEFTQQQKIVVVLKVIELIVADGEVSERETILLNQIGIAFHFTHEEIDEIKSYVMSRERADLDRDNILLIDHETKDDLTHAKHLYRENLSAPIAFYRIPKLDIYFAKALGDDPLTNNGVPIRTNKTIVFSAGSSIRGTKITPIFYSDIISHYRKETNETKISFVAEKVEFEFPNGHKGLRGIDIAESSGKLIGLMGGSGAGKSTLLNVLNGNDAPSSGSVRINGIDIHREHEKIEGIIGYVPQDDLLIEELTVYDNLHYAAQLCFKDRSSEELNELVEGTLSSLGLLATRNLKVGSVLEKTISGGQRKRLNIGLELLREPSVMFVDEPTSGLSSRDSENIMDLLKELSLRGKMIFVVIHQPSSDIFKMFDKLVILDVGGYQIYYGNPVEGVIYFKKIVKLMDKDDGSCVECGNVNSEQIFNIIETKVVDEYGQLTDTRKLSPKDWNMLFNVKIKVPKAEEATEKPEKTLNIPNKIKQLMIFSKRDLAAKLSNKQYLIINLLEAPILALLLAFIIRYSAKGQDYSFAQNPNIPAFFFMSIIVALFMGLTVSAEEIFKDRKILKRESFLNLSRSSYLVSKMSILFVLSAVQTLMFVIIGDWVLEIQSMSISFWLVLFSISCFANILGLNISSAFNSAVTIYILIPLLLIPQLILSGVVVNFDKLNPLLSNDNKVPIIGEMMASKWGYEALVVSQFKDNAFKKHFFEYDQTIANSEFKSVYFYPAIENAVDYALKNHKTEDKAIQNKVSQQLALAQKELSQEMKAFNVPDGKFKAIDGLTIDRFDQDVYDETIHFIKIMKKVHNQRMKTASQERDGLSQSMSDTPEKAKALIKLRSENENESISFFLKNTTTKNRLLVTDDALIQKIYPIYKRPSANGPLDFRSHFYAPEKHFMGQYYDTLPFNVIIIWIMSHILFLTLYFDVLKKIVNSFGR
ncbi:ABC-type multidrug transport system, ATPase component [Reichenbachiella agariperforans]|uniref:ABC-type multidrug transport system, ATPase component n=1 Tax=Reichenbachiella agariperforans TaxID=156994 RepID=A0A1M6VGY5_REIAG|nr:ATP-binding cassette domain-containing protein [Reichenbachiella agariperforans]SHK80621.1 ABC-type multidrug transport system, ATPase component [Reichenbachiella agariperforans]